MYRSTGNASSMHVWLARYPDILLPLECKIPKFGHSCIHCVIQNSQLLRSCVHYVIQNAHFDLKFKIRTLRLCENSLSGLWSWKSCIQCVCHYLIIPCMRTMLVTRPDRQQHDVGYICTYLIYTNGLKLLYHSTCHRNIYSLWSPLM